MRVLRVGVEVAVVITVIIVDVNVDGVRSINLVLIVLILGLERVEVLRM